LWWLGGLECSHLPDDAEGVVALIRVFGPADEVAGQHSSIPMCGRGGTVAWTFTSFGLAGGMGRLG
jgi:hypothetical protein